MNGDAFIQLNQLKEILTDSVIGLEGITELTEIFQLVEKLGLKSTHLNIDVTLARGLNYYTGAIFEVVAPEGVQMGSIGGGGRYDDLTGIFGLHDVSGIGISFGLDRIYLVLEELDLFPEKIGQNLDVLCLNFGKSESEASLGLVSKLREAGLRSDIYPSAVKVQKQFKYANKREVPYVILIGDQELKKSEFIVKNMKTGEQKTYALDHLEDFVEIL